MLLRQTIALKETLVKRLFARVLPLSTTYLADRVDPAVPIGVELGTEHITQCSMNG
jgi:hypothetical protein